jgi:CRISPR-associated helicase Cas3/CRISPR-associated endonuclease Cas3-HD
MKKYLAKSDGTLLIDHSKLVSDVAVIIYETTVKYQDERIRETIRIGGLLHDIGKCTNHFQKLLKKGFDNEETEKDCGSYKRRHNEIGWMFLRDNFTHKHKNDILDVVYWHHGVSPNNFKTDGFYKGDVVITDEDENNMKEYLTNTVGDYLMDVSIPKPFKRPDYFIHTDDDHNETNEERMLIRSCIISADRIVSSGKCDNLSMEQIKEYIKDYNKISTNINVETHIFNSTSSERFQKQIEITKEVINDENNTHIIKAPGGFGKTITGILWALQRNKRLIWVCPRNDIADSVYETIINELKGFENGESISVELFLTGEIQKQNHNNNEFDSDIIVTNIDNFLNPTVDNRYSHRLFTIMESDVVFDEYHELVSDNALFSLFILMMRLRHRITNSSTLLLSATPNILEVLWDNTDRRTKILPNKESHYKSQHNKKYKISVLNECEITDLSRSSALLMNSISNSQRMKNRLDLVTLYHSHYTKSDRKRILTKIFENYDKNSDRTTNKPGVVSTHVLQASLDISFLNLYESVLSPESTIQRFCRCDRFGDYDEQSTFTIFKNIKSLEKGERKMREILYKESLTNEWFDYMEQYNETELTMDEMFVLYNNFIGIKFPELKKFIGAKFSFGLSKLSELYPLKLYKAKKTKVKTAGGNKLRNSGGNEIFVIAQYYNDSNKFSDPISVDTYGNISETFNEPQNVERRIINTFKHLKDDVRFDYGNLYKCGENLTIDQIRKYGKKDDTPYVRFDKVYHPEYGFVNRNIID